jgi:hypothetical protein
LIALNPKSKINKILHQQLLNLKKEKLLAVIQFSTSGKKSLRQKNHFGQKTPSDKKPLRTKNPFGKLKIIFFFVGQYSALLKTICRE